MEDVLFIVDLKYLDEQKGEVDRIEVYKDGSMWDVNLPSHGCVYPWDDTFKLDEVNLKGVSVNLPNVLTYLEDGGEVEVQKVVHSPSGRVIYEVITDSIEES